MNKEYLIQKYFKNSLSADEKKQFLELQKSDADFGRAIAEYEDLQAAILEDERLEMKKRLANLENNRSEKGGILPKRKFSSRQMWQWAAAATILLVIGFFAIFPFTDNADSTDLYATYFEPYPNAVQPVVRGEQPENLREAAFLAYENGEYQAAVQQFEALVKSAFSTENQLYYALSLQNAGQLDNALKNLLSLKNVESSFRPQILWYTALIYLKKGDKNKARQYLNSLQKTDGKYKEKEAAELLNKLN